MIPPDLHSGAISFNFTQTAHRLRISGAAVVDFDDEAIALESESLITKSHRAEGTPLYA
jgi:hypothetical protein